MWIIALGVGGCVCGVLVWGFLVWKCYQHYKLQQIHTRLIKDEQYQSLLPQNDEI
ncbi:protein ORF44 [Lake sturgeon herpesvirus]|nr:protein ORF44 [Lake sturgeon herpesvirus]